MSDEEGMPELEITYFTDPLCCRSWGMHPHPDSLQERLHAAQLTHRPVN